MPESDIPAGRAAEIGAIDLDPERRPNGVVVDGARVRSLAERNRAAILPILQRRAEGLGVPEAMQFAPKA